MIPLETEAPPAAEERRGAGGRLRIPPWMGKMVYGLLFSVGLPLALAAWASRLDAFVALPAYRSVVGGGLAALAGAALLCAAMAELWLRGGGLPMSAYPPARFVSSGPYRYLANPIYVGAVMVSGGVALALGSPAGLWVVTPVLAMAAGAWVLGYERDATRRRFASGVRAPLLHLPPESEALPTRGDRWSVYGLAFGPWLLLYGAVEALGVPPDAVVAWSSWDRGLPVLPWMELPYFAVYPFVLAVPLVAGRRTDLRWFITRAWCAMALILPLYLLVPVIAPAKPVPGDGVLATLMRWERALDAPVTAFPAFHVVWFGLAAVIYRRRWPRLAALWWLLLAAVSASCLAVGLHAGPDVGAALVALAFLASLERMWSVLRRWTEGLANSWAEWRMGPLRLINHGTYAGIGAWAGTLIAVTLAGPGQLPGVLGLASVAIAAAALWAQLVEGSSQLLRPYGYFGSLLGTLLAAATLGAAGRNGWLPLAALAVGGSVTQAIGRARCLVQGCCHGSECAEWLGIRYTHPRSRVTRLSALGGRPLYPTPLFSALWMLLAAAILARLWALGAGLQFIVGLYMILVGLGRFVEEHYRGEPQTAVWGGLHLYQWLAIASVLAGGWLTTLGWTPAPSMRPPSGGAILGTGLFGLAAYVAYGVDFPRAHRRFSRLA